MKEIYLAGGCFWGAEAYLKAVHGVCETEVGYANGNVEAPTYEMVCTGTTGCAETVRALYDSETLPLEKLLWYYFESVDPVSVNRQGGDVGEQYRTGIYYTEEAQAEVVQKALSQLEAKLGKPVAIQAERLRNFFRAEEYHQDYLVKNPGGYCHIPRLKIERIYNDSRK